MALAELYTGSAVTISTTEISLVSGTSTLQTDTTDGLFQLFVEANNMAAGDQYRIQIYEKVLSGGTKRLIDQFDLLGVQPKPVWVGPALFLMHGWDFTLIKIAGTDRAFSWSIRQVS